MNILSVKSLHDAKSIILSDQNTITLQTESVHLLESHGRIASETLYSPVDVPAFNRSTVDGYAVKTPEVMGASESIPSILTLKNEVMMGESASSPLKSGEAIYVPTGGMIPEGADGMVMIEHSEVLDEQTLLIKKPIAFGENITYRGDDLKENDAILKTGEKISAYDMGVLAGVGIGWIKVFEKIKIAVLSTGDEIIDYDQEPKSGQIRDINGYTLSGASIACGGQVVYKALIKDDFEALRVALDHAVHAADIVILSGGSSVGTRDFTFAAIESFESGEILLHGISVKPGKPTIIGKIDGKMVFGLPGHPAASAIIFEILVKPYIEKCQMKQSGTFKIGAKLTSNLHAAPGKDTFVMVTLHRENGINYATPIHGKSGLMTLLTKATGYIQITSELEGLYKDQEVEVNLLKEVTR
ncbi:MAG: molybdopterin molybdotransferase MoeA [Clostridia bacterium]|nr:molybdopterin molybdotransferase MoeA [Clostridia bacterium]